MGNNSGKDGQHTGDALKLTPTAVAFLETCLQEVGEFGEIHLVVQNGQLRFVRTVKSVNFHTVCPNGES